jgi:hypothetical protein
VWGLPESSATWDGQGWGVDQELQATTAEGVWAVAQILTKVHGGKKAKNMKPIRFPRPRRRGEKTGSARAFDRMMSQAHLLGKRR